MSTLCSDDSVFDSLVRHYGEELCAHATSKFNSSRGKRLWDSLLREKASK